MKKIALILLSATLLMGMGERPQLPVPVAKPTLEKCEASPVGYALIQEFEGYMPFIYADVGGKATVGFGHLILPGETFEQPFLPEAAQALLIKDAIGAVSGVKKDVTVPLKPAQCDALIAFTFNLGRLRAAAPTLLKYVNQVRHSDAAKQFMVYNKVRVKGKLVEVKGLTRRRQAESDLYRSADE